MNITFIGYGNVGGALADRLQRLDHVVTLAANDPQSESVKKALARNGNLKVVPSQEAVRNAAIVFLATPFQANEEALKTVATELEGKVLVDCTNPVGPGVVHGLDSKRSGTEMVQGLLPKTQVVKAFTIYGYENLEDNSYPGYNVKPVMMYCGNDVAAKLKVASLI